ncbi:MAG: DedA family protein [Pirellulales bacterium]
MYELLSHSHYLGIVLVLVLSGFGLPIPEEVPVVMAGILSANGTLDPRLAFAACIVGAIAGDCLMYGLGYKFGRSVIMEHPRITGFLTPERERQIEATIMRHGVKALFLARFMVGVRSPVYLTAGILRVPFRRFLLADTFCAIAVVSVFFGLSFKFGDRITNLIRDSQLWLTGLVAVIALGFSVWFLVRRRRKLVADLQASRGEKQALVATEPAKNGRSPQAYGADLHASATAGKARRDIAGS